jgi:hypothetical protein
MLYYFYFGDYIFILLKSTDCIGDLFLLNAILVVFLVAFVVVLGNISLCFFSDVFLVVISDLVFNFLCLL